MEGLQQKYQRLLDALRALEGLVTAYSGGVDSTLLAYAANKVLGKRALAVTAVSVLSPVGETKRAVDYANEFGFRHRILEVDVLADPKVAANLPDRCYHCKHRLFTLFREVAREENISWVADGSNLDDLNQYRPGNRAAHELGILSPLQQANLSKVEIRELSQELNLPTWDQPSLACLASRIPYNTPLQESLLYRVSKIEVNLRQMGFQQVRVRHHGELARVELAPLDLELVQARREDILRIIRDEGYIYVCIDLEGYRFGSLDEWI